MKKAILTILLCGVMVLGMTGCGKSKNEFDIGNKSDIKVSQNDVIMTIKEGTLTNKSATLVLTNNRLSFQGHNKRKYINTDRQQV